MNLISNESSFQTLSNGMQIIIVPPDPHWENCIRMWPQPYLWLTLVWSIKPN